MDTAFLVNFKTNNSDTNEMGKNAHTKTTADQNDLSK
jgi:hypothetical protein